MAAKQPGKLDIDVTQVKSLVELVEKYHLDELTVEHKDVAITVKSKAAQAAERAIVQEAANPASTTARDAGPEQPAAAEPEPVHKGNIVDIVAPLVGVFYRAPAPDAPHFVEVGDEIEVGSEVGLIEAMKVFSPIPSEVAGEVVEIPGKNGQLVREGEVLVRVRLAEE